MKRPRSRSSSLTDENGGGSGGSGGEFECPRCHHRFLHQHKLDAHRIKKQKCQLNDHFVDNPHSDEAQAVITRNSSGASPTSSGASRWAQRADSGGLSAERGCKVRVTRSRALQLEARTRLDPATVHPDFVCHANTSIAFKMAHTPADFGPEFGSFAPQFTHQLFTEEEIVGYKKLNLRIYFTAASLTAFFELDYEERCPGADRVQQEIAVKMAPDSIAPTRDQFITAVHDDAEFVPPGRLVHTYTIPTVDSKDSVEYELYSGDLNAPGMRAYHRRLQFFLLFFIDRSSFINDLDPVWEILIVFEKRLSRATGQQRRSLLGYTTLYKFFAFPNSWRWRLSQILVLPPYQRSGHGQRVLEFISTEAERRHFLEVNVEDPAPGFQSLRDQHEIKRCRDHDFYQKHPDEKGEGPGAACQSWDTIYAQQVVAVLRLPLSQVRRCYEILKLAQTDSRNAKMMDTYKKEVKQRLARTHETELSVNYRGQARLDRLEQLYVQLLDHYHQCIKKARVH